MVRVEFKVNEIYARWAKIIDKPVEEFDEPDRKAALYDYQEVIKQAFRSSAAPTKKQRLAERRAQRRKQRKEKYGD